MEIETTKTIYDKMVSHQFVVSIMGQFDQELLLSIINMTDRKLTDLEVGDSFKKKIFHFMVECSQNLLKVEKTGGHSHKNIFLIGQENDEYIVHLGTALTKKRLAPVLEAINMVNTIEAAEIKKKYLEELASSALINQDFLLLSMLSISKKTKAKINYDLIDIDDESTFLAFKMTMTN
jgi:hypothetical protein